jgi:hypothetical protein
MKLDQNDFPGLSAASAYKMAGKVQRQSVKQITAADATLGIWTAEYDGVIGDAGIQLGAALADVVTDETMSFDVKKNGTSIMTGGTPLVLGPTTTLVHDLYLSLDKDKCSFVKGDVFVVTLDYTVGSAPTPLVNTEVWLEPTFGVWRK